MRRWFRSEAFPKSLATELEQLLGNRFTTSTALRQQHGTDESYHSSQLPDAVVFPQTTQEVSKIVKYCAQHHIPMIPFGAGSSLEGHISAVNGGLSIDLSTMTSITQIDTEDMLCHVQAGVTRQQLDTELRATGLFFPVDPGSEATLGGMVATNASGTTTVRYGGMKQNVTGLTAVLADGTIIKTGTKTRKSSAGYDLTRLIIGSEGTLAIVTEIDVRLHGIPAVQKTAVCSFPTIHDAVSTCAMVMQMGIPVARMELMDEATVKAVNAYSDLQHKEHPSLLIELHGSGSELKDQSDTISEIAQDFNVDALEWGESLEERKKLWDARHKAFYAIQNLKPGASSLVTDVCVPISKLADVIVETQADMRENKILGGIVGHVGDGNFHVILPMDPASAEFQQVHDFSDRLVDRALKAEGTCTGEHGIGLGKMDYLRREMGNSAVDAMLNIKKAWDPFNLLNPGKVFYGHQ